MSFYTLQDNENHRRAKSPFKGKDHGFSAPTGLKLAAGTLFATPNPSTTVICQLSLILDFCHPGCFEGCFPLPSPAASFFSLIRDSFSGFFAARRVRGGKGRLEQLA